MVKYLKLLLGLFLIAFSFNLFFIRYNIVIGDVVGLSLILNKTYNIDFFMFILAFNLITLALSYALLDEKFFRSAAAASVLLPVLIRITLPLTNLLVLDNLEVIVIVIIGAIGIGAGYGLIKSEGFNTGGIEILSDLLTSPNSFSSASLNLIINIIIVGTSTLYFGLDNAIYALIATLIIVQLSNHIMLGVGNNKTFYIYTNKEKEIKKYLLETEGVDVTIFDAKGGFKRKILRC